MVMKNCEMVINEEKGKNKHGVFYLDGCEVGCLLGCTVG